MNKSIQDEFVSTVKNLTDEDCIWLLHVFNNDVECFEQKETILENLRPVYRKDIDYLNSIQKLSEIRKYILDKVLDYSDKDISYLLKDIIKFKSRLKVRSINLSKYSTNERIQMFFSNIETSDSRKYECNILRINNKYFRILYLLFVVVRQNEAEEILKNIETSYSELISKHNAHFKGSYGLDFFTWAKSYMDVKEDYHSKQYDPIDDDDFEKSVNHIFDFLWYENLNAYAALKDRVANAWYQKAHREKNKGKKAYQIVLSKKAKAELDTLVKKLGYSEERLIENLIGEKYVNECMDQQGNPKYDF